MFSSALSRSSTRLFQRKFAYYLIAAELDLAELVKIKQTAQTNYPPMLFIRNGFIIMYQGKRILLWQQTNKK